MSQQPLKSPVEILQIQDSLEVDYEKAWTICAKNSRLNRDWQDLVLLYPENSLVCYRHLLTQPLQRVKFRAFPLRGKQFRGVWEYEITGGDRVFYLPNKSERSVLVIYAGKHPKKNKYPKAPK